jgi:hypothetical protein
MVVEKPMRSTMAFSGIRLQHRVNHPRTKDSSFRANWERTPHKRTCRLLRGSLLLFAGFGLEVFIQGCAVEGDDDDFAAVAVVAVFVVFGDVDDGEGDGDDVSFFEQDAGALHLVPVVDGAVGVADEVFGGVVGEAAEGPVVDAVGGGEMEGFAVVPVIDEDVKEAAAEPDDGVFKILGLADGQLGDGGVDGWAFDGVGAEDAGFADPDAAGAGDDFKGAVGADHDAEVGHALFLRAEEAGRELDAADVCPGAVERTGDEDIAGAGLADDDGIAAVGEDERGDVMAFAFLIAGPAEALVDIGAEEGVADGVDGLGAEPGVVAEGLVPAAGKDVVFAVGAVDDLAIPVVPVLHGGVFEAVFLVARADGGCSPGGGGEGRDDGRGEEIVDEGFGGLGGGREGQQGGGGGCGGEAEKPGEWHADNHSNDGDGWTMRRVGGGWVVGSIVSDWLLLPAGYCCRLADGMRGCFGVCGKRLDVGYEA